MNEIVKLLVVALQILLLLVYLVLGRNLVKESVSFQKKKSMFMLLLLNSWAILFGIQFLFGPIFSFGDGFANYFELIGLFLYVLGVATAIWGRVAMYNNWGLPMQHNFKLQSRLITKGVYSISRNPIYLSEILMFVGFELMLNSWLLLFLVYFILFNYIKIRKEEELLTEAFGVEYKEYLRKTARFLG